MKDPVPGTAVVGGDWEVPDGEDAGALVVGGVVTGLP